MNIKIIIAAHKKYRMPEGKVYLPVHVGAAGKEPIEFNTPSVRDDQGDNISLKNPYYCELTGLYWAWKNLVSDYLGLAHYRRHFCLKTSRDVWSCILSDGEAADLCGSFDIIVPAKRRYYIETLYSHYAHTHDASHLDITRDILYSLYPDFLSSWDKVLKQTYGYMFNMFIMRRDLADSYCSFLFDILSELERRTDRSGLSAFEARYFGRVSEILFNVWLEQKLKDDGSIRIKEIKYIYTEDVSRTKKAIAFLQAKYTGRKYEQSF